MGNEFRYRCLMETRRLLLLMGVVFGMILFIQYFEQPYSNILSSFVAPSQVLPAEIHIFPSINSSTVPTSASRNLTLSGIINSPDENVSDDVSRTIRVSDGKGSDISSVKDDFDPGESFDNKAKDYVDPEDEFPTDDFSAIDLNSTSERVDRNSSFQSERTRENAVELTSSGAYVNSSFVVTSVGEHDESVLQINKKPKILKHDPAVPVSNPSITKVATTKKGFEGPASALVTITEMNGMLLQSHVSYSAVKPLWPSPVDQELWKVQSLIENAPIIENSPQFDVSLYRNFSAFKRSYELMDRMLKVYIYAEGDRPIFHQPPLKGIYASEGWFMKQLKGNRRFVTKNPKKAHLFYLPFSSRALEVTLYVPDSHNRKPLIKVLGDYVQTIRMKYSFWNRTLGSDHFLVACHDWVPSETRETMSNCIRALCNSDIREGFQFGKDASLPETSIRTPQNPLRQLGGKPPSKRWILAFFAGSMHGYLRPILLNHWENKDPDIKIFGRMRKARGQMSYVQYMKSSKYCICARGFEVNSPRVVEAIFYECVPVIISDNFVPPFFETLDWESFAVFILEKDIPNLKNILLSISKKRYLEMHRRVKHVQQHFLWHSRPVKYDVFHMILHSVWHNRVFQTRPL